MNRTTLQTVFVIGLGAGLGYIAAIGGLDTARWALAAGELGTRSRGPSASTEGNACCSEGAARSGLLSLASSAVLPGSTAAVQGGKKPNIVIIWGDDVGQSNISAYT